jgi:hypothetical protein
MTAPDDPPLQPTTEVVDPFKHFLEVEAQSGVLDPQNDRGAVSGLSG